MIHWSPIDHILLRKQLINFIRISPTPASANSVGTLSLFAPRIDFGRSQLHVNIKKKSTNFRIINSHYPIPWSVWNKQPTMIWYSNNVNVSYLSKPTFSIERNYRRCSAAIILLMITMDVSFYKISVIINLSTRAVIHWCIVSGLISGEKFWWYQIICQ